MKRIYYFLIPLVAIFLYYPVINAGYVWDDNLLFVQKIKLVNEPLSWDILTEPVLPGTTYFRPLIFLTMYMEFNLFGQTPVSSHIINLVILIINSYLVSLITYSILKLNKRKNFFSLSLLAGLVYVVNPVLVEATAWISGRFDLLVTTFTLISIYLFIKLKPNTWYGSIAISSFFFLALLSKELGIIIPVLTYFMYMFLNIEKENSYIINTKNFIYNNFRLIFCFFSTLVFYFILRIDAMGGVYHQKINDEYIKFAYLKEYLPIHSIYFYLKQFIFPFQSLTPLLSYNHLNDNFNVLIFKFFIIFLFSIFLVFGVVKKNKYVWLVFSVLLTISLVVYIVPITISNNIAHNRFMTLGAAFFSILVSVLPYQKLSPFFYKLACSIILVWLFSSILVTKSIVPFWKSDFTLWKWTYTMQPDNELARNSYLYGLYQEKKFNEIVYVIKNYQHKYDIGLTVQDQIIYVNALISLNNSEALEYAKGVEMALPKYHLLYKNKSEYKMGDIPNANIASFYGAYALAVSVFDKNPQKSLELNKIASWYLEADERVPYDYNNIAYLYQSGRVEEARKIYNYLLEVNSYNKDHYIYNMLDIVKIACLNSKINSGDTCSKERATFINYLIR
ncbi:hypothetical protein [Acinetobacter tandoii]